jgi:hypothetical protein
MHRSWNSVYLNHYISSLKTIWTEHHGKFGTKPCALLRQMSGPSESGSGLAKIMLTSLTMVFVTLTLLMIMM